MKRSRLFPILVITLLGTVAIAQESAIEATRLGERFSFLVEVEFAPEEEILDSLREGMRAEVEYRVQLYRESSGIWRLFGDRLVEEYESRRIAYFDPFTRSFRIDSYGAFPNGEERYDEEGAFLAAFLTLRSTPLYLPENGSDYRLRGRTVVRPIRVAPPLGLMGLFVANNRYSSSWVSVEL